MRVGRLDAELIDRASEPVDISDGISLCEAVAVSRGVLLRIKAGLVKWKPWTYIPVTVAVAVLTQILERRCR